MHSFAEGGLSLEVVEFGVVGVMIMPLDGCVCLVQKAMERVFLGVLTTFEFCTTLLEMDGTWFACGRRKENSPLLT